MCATSSELKNQDPQQNSAKIPKARFKSTSSDDEEPHRYINPVEAKAHIEALENLMTMIKNKVEKQEMTDLLENVLSNMKEVLANLTPTMQLADTSIISRAIRTKTLMCYYLDPIH